VTVEKRVLAEAPKGLPEWAAVSFYDPETKELYLPAICGGNEAAVLLSLGFDGTKYVRDGDHIYAPVSWLEREFPENREFFMAAKEKHRLLSEQG